MAPLFQEELLTLHSRKPWVPRSAELGQHWYLPPYALLASTWPHQQYSSDTHQLISHILPLSNFTFSNSPKENATYLEDSDCLCCLLLGCKWGFEQPLHTPVLHTRFGIKRCAVTWQIAFFALGICHLPAQNTLPRLLCFGNSDSSWKHAFGGSFPALLADHAPL